MSEEIHEKDIKLGTLFDFNRQAMSGMIPLKDNIINAKMLDISKWMADNFGCRYFMLLSNENRDYTVINLIKNNYKEASNEIKEVIKSRGELLSVDKFENSYEIWIKSDDNILFYLLFPCDDFIIEIK